MLLSCPHKENVYKYASILLPAILSLFLCFAPFDVALAATVVLLPVLLAFSFARPITGIYALIITASALDMVPEKFNLQLFVFLLVCVTVFVRFVLNIKVSLMKTLSAHVETKILFCFALLIFSNFFVAQVNGISASLWLRGSVPFLFLLLTFACLHYYRTQEHLIHTLISVVIYSTILMVRQLCVSVHEKVWVPERYIYEVGVWVRSMDDTGELFWKRITMLFPQSTDPAFVIGFFILLIWFINDPRRRLLALVPLYGLLLCMVLTYSKSFIIALTVGFFFIAGHLFFRRRRLLAGKFLAGYVVTIVCIVLTVELFDLAPFRHRYVVFFNAIHEISDTWRSFRNKEVNFYEKIIAIISNAEVRVADPNITSRADEIQIAWALFKEDPLLGKGFGIQHDIVYDTGFGVAKTFTKGYIHNWFFYFLMTTGLIGTVLYSSIYLVPFFRLFRSPVISVLSEVELIVATSILLLNLYSMLFASFRLIPYNIVLACLVSMPLVLTSERLKIMASKSAQNADGTLT